VFGPDNCPSAALIDMDAGHSFNLLVECPSMDDLSVVLGAISHPSRRAILDRLADGPARVTEIAAPFDMSLNAVSKHLKVLEGAGLVDREVQGRDHLIRFRGDPLRMVSQWVHEYERFWNQRLDRLEQHFKNERGKKKS
jgi:DNA-binding transcriptional ArsR family regulator